MDALVHIASAITSGLAAALVLYVSYRMLQSETRIKEWVTKAIVDNCAGKVEFNAHSDADLVFQKTLTASIMEKRAEYTQMHKDHYEHSNKTDIHQASMSKELLEEKFRGMSAQFEDLKKRGGRAIALLEER